MPRGSVKRLTSDIDLGRWLRGSDNLPAELSSQSLFGNDLPLEIEIGSGKGLFLATAAQAHPGHNYVGLPWSPVGGSIFGPTCWITSRRQSS
jgi:tRNA (guanine-N7-)-methyltransferase